MAGVQDESDDDIEVLDLTTPVPPPPRSRLAPTRATATTAASSSPLGSPSLGHSSSLTDEQGASDDQSVGEVDSDDLFGVDEWKPLRERLKPVVAAGTAARGIGSSATMAASGKSRSIPPPAIPAAAAAAAAGSPTDEEKKRRRNAATRAGAGGGGGGAAAAAAAVAVGRGRSGKGKSKLREAAGGSGDMCWQEEEEEEEEEEECFMNTQESEVVDLLSDSDDADEVAPGRSQLWNRGGGGGSGGGGGGAGSDREEEEEPQVLADSADTLGLDEFDSLLLASQTSSKESPARPSRAARRARDGVNRGGALGAGGGVAGSGGTVAGACALDVDDSDDDFSMDPVGACSQGRMTPSSGGDGGGDGDSDDAGAVGAVVASKQQKALERKEATANKKRQRQEAAAAVKHQRERERSERKQDKERAKQAEKVEKAAKKEKEQQARGNFSHLEVTCVMERRYFDSSRSACVRAGVSEQPGHPEKFKVAAGVCGTVGAVWWTRRAYLDGGAATSGPGVKTLDILIVVVDPKTLFDKLGHSGAGGGSGGSGGGGSGAGGAGGGGGGAFPSLDRFVDGIRASASEFSRLVLVLEGAEGELHQRRSRRPASGSAGGAAWSIVDDFEDALCWLLIHKDVETRPTKDGEETGQYLWDLTKSLSTMPYKDDVTELHCVTRSNAQAKGSALLPKEQKDLADTWVRMLEQVSGISESMAQAIAQIYPLPRDLAAALLDPNVPEAERATLLADKLGTKTTEGKRARRIFDLFTQEDGDFVLP